MTTVIGHTSTVARVEVQRPAVSLFLGPSSVGKWTVAEYLRGVWRVEEADTLRIENLTMPSVRTVVDFAERAAAADRRLVVIRLDGAREDALNVLLKTLEEGHESTDFILIAEETPMATIATRSTIFRFGFLAEREVEEVLTDRNFRPEDAHRYATMSGGQVSRALDVVNKRDVRHGVMIAVRAFRDADPAVLESAAKEWSDDHTALLATWCRECLTGRARIFSEEELVTARRLPFLVLQALSANVRPRLLVRSSLMSVLREA